MARSQSLLAMASSNLVGRKSKSYFIIKFSPLLPMVLYWREIRPDTGKTIKTLVLLTNRHVCLVALSLTNTLF